MGEERELGGTPRRREPKHVIPHPGAGDAVAHIVHDSCGLGTRIGGTGRFGPAREHPAAHLVVVGIDRRGTHPDPHLPCAGVGLGDVCDMEDLGPAVAGVLHRAHHSPSLMRTRAGIKASR